MFSNRDVIFTGDTLLKGEIGRIDVTEGDRHIMKKSLKRISKLPTRIIIYPGHGESTMLSNELKYNNKFIEAMEWE